MLGGLLQMVYYQASLIPTAWCVVACIFCMNGPMVFFELRQNRAFKNTQRKENAVASESDEIYAALRLYFVEEKLFVQFMSVI